MRHYNNMVVGADRANEVGGHAPRSMRFQHIAGIEDSLEKVPNVLAELENRKKNRISLMLNGVTDLGIHYAGQPRNEWESGFRLKLDGVDMPLTKTAVQTACRLVNASPRHFEQYADPDALPKALRNIIDDNPGRKSKELILRHNGLQVEAILPGNYEVHDDFEIVRDFATEIQSIYGADQIHGMERLALNSDGISGGDGSHTSYRMVIGGDILGGPDIMDPSKGVMTGDHTFLDKGGSPLFLMFVLSSSELGLVPTEATLGLYRLVCRNGALLLDQRQVVARWNHETPPGDFYKKTFALIRRSGFFQNVCSRVFKELRGQPLGIDAFDLLSALHDERYIGQQHYEAAQSYVLNGVDGDAGEGPGLHRRDIKTAYEFFNALTASAQDVGNLKDRQRAETNALKLAMTPGGWGSILAGEKRAKEKLI